MLCIYLLRQGLTMYPLTGLKPGCSVDQGDLKLIENHLTLPPESWN